MHFDKGTPSSFKPWTDKEGKGGFGEFDKSVIEKSDQLQLKLEAFQKKFSGENAGNFQFIFHLTEDMKRKDGESEAQFAQRLDTTIQALDKLAGIIERVQNEYKENQTVSVQNIGVNTKYRDFCFSKGFELIPQDTSKAPMVQALINSAYNQIVAEFAKELGYQNKETLEN